MLHDRGYRVESFLLDNGNLLIQGAVRDQKPPGVYIPDDPEPLTMHYVQVTLAVEFPSRIIVSVECIEAERAGEPNPIIVRPPCESWKTLTNTCHVWADDGLRKAEVERGGVQTIPVDIRLQQLGRSPRT